MEAFRKISVCLSILACLLGMRTEDAKAFELFGMHIFGEKPEIGALRYNVSFKALGDDLDDVLESASQLVSNETTGAADYLSLAARVREDRERLRAALYAEGRYGGMVDIHIDGKSLDEAELAARDTAPAEPANIVIIYNAGPEFTFGSLAIEAVSGIDADAPSTNPVAYGLEPGAVARSSQVVKAADVLVSVWRQSGHPLAKILTRRVAADHERRRLDVTLVIDPGPEAVYGSVTVTGTANVNEEVIAEQSAIEPGARYNSTDLRKARDRLTKLQSVASVRIVQGEALDEQGRIPIMLDITERKPRYFGAAASMSTTDGGEVSAYWGHRSFFGGAEQLRVDGSIANLGNEGLDQLYYKFAVNLTKPGIYDRDTDIFANLRLEREIPESYESRSARAKTGLAHHFDDELSGTAAVEIGFDHIEDAFGTTDYYLLSLPVDALYDSRDDRLDPVSGFHGRALMAPTVDFAGGSAYILTEAQLSTYLALDEEGNFVLASRLGAGSIIGAGLADVPASSRFFAGGGGSVRGYEYRSLGPSIDGDVVGGLSFVEGSAEFRAKLTEKFGVVAFADAASVSADTFPGADSEFFLGAGLGLRYYTSLGPIRLDLAMPLTDVEGAPDYAFYVGLGQAF